LEIVSAKLAKALSVKKKQLKNSYSAKQSRFFIRAEKEFSWLHKKETSFESFLLILKIE